MIEQPSYEKDPSVTLSLAASIVQRQIDENAWQRTILAETVPVQPTLPVEVARSVQTGVTVAMLKALENPEAMPDSDEIARTIIDENTLKNILLSTNEEPTDENMALVRAIIYGQIKNSMEHFSSDEKARARLGRLLQSADVVATQHEVIVPEVFADDELYSECMRTMYTPEAFAEETAESLEKLNQEFVLSTLSVAADAMLQMEVANGEISTEEYEQLKQDYINEILQDEDALADINVQISVVRQGALRVISKSIERFWGAQSLTENSGILGSLATRFASSGELSGGLLRQQKYNDIVVTVCMEKGWDPDELTVDQMRYISSRPEMQQIDQDTH